jgi:hypothetical protein
VRWALIELERVFLRRRRTLSERSSLPESSQSPPTGRPVAPIGSMAPVGTETIVVECGRCAQPFAVLVSLFSGPLYGSITVPPHRKLGRNGPEDAICDGSEVPAIAKGLHPAWPQRWAAEHPGYATPEILDGSRVRVRGVR